MNSTSPRQTPLFNIQDSIERSGAKTRSNIPDQNGAYSSNLDAAGLGMSGLIYSPLLTPNDGKLTSEPSIQSDHFYISAREIKRYNREVTRKTFLHQESELIAKRSKLIDKKFDVGLSKCEENQLKYIDWQLDRIEDAIGGEQLDELETWVQAHEQIRESVESFSRQVQAVTRRGSKRRRS